jgi:hypothetical protein
MITKGAGQRTGHGRGSDRPDPADQLAAVAIRLLITRLMSPPHLAIGMSSCSYQGPR